MKAIVAAFNQEKALVGAFSVITNLRMELFQATVEAVSDVAAAAATSLDPRQPTINQQHQGQGPSAAGAGAGVLVSGQWPSPFPRL